MSDFPEPLLRYERKAVLSKADCHDLQYWFKNNGLQFSQPYPDRLVNNIYFDCPSYSAYSENASGISNRAKCRLRWYGSRLKPKKFQFEVKIKENMVGRKIICPIDAKDLETSAGRLYSSLRTLVSDEAKVYLDQAHKPVVYNAYSRQYFADKFGTRITFDSDLFHSIANANLFPVKTPERSEVFGVLEVKYPMDLVDHVRATIETLPFYFTKNSKYSNAVDLY